jgi:ribosomal protein L11 methylase PrmA
MCADVQERFAFGENWLKYLKNLNSKHIEEAKTSLLNKLEINSLDGASFLDIGSGSGLFSLAARMSGAKVHSFDYDLQSVACTKELRRRYFPEDPNY